MSKALRAIESAVAAVTDRNDHDQVVAALRALSPALIEDVVFGEAAEVLGASADGVLVGVGTGVSPGIGIGRAVFSSLDALEWFNAGQEVVLVAEETAPTDEPGLRIAAGIITRAGDAGSHAAILARQWGIPAVCGFGSHEIAEGAQLLLDGRTGEVRAVDMASGSGAAGSDFLAPGLAPASGLAEGDEVGRAGRPLNVLPAAVESVLEWADKVTEGRIRVLSNADSLEQVELALQFGASGVGLCRTEEQIRTTDLGLLGRVAEGEISAMFELAAAQHEALAPMLIALGGRPITLRLLDMDGTRVANHMATGRSEGLRGAKFLLGRPEVLAAQCEGIVRAVDQAVAAGVNVDLSCCVPMISATAELQQICTILTEAFARFAPDQSGGARVRIGTMIETPRSALIANSLAGVASFFCFGTNDLTALTWGVPRENSSEWVLRSIEHGVFDRDPFESIDPIGVARLLALAIETGRSQRPDLGVTLCGAQAADPASIAMAVALKMDAISVSPNQVPAARLAACHAVLG